MNLSDSYYEDEVREDFYIPGMIKRSWASQTEILDNVRKICEKHDIKWFADYGTLIGAVRHHGFIPWDDDLDICMFKDDYDRFLEVAKKELPSGYRIINIYNKEEYNNLLTRVVNHSKIDMGAEFLNNNHGFPYVSGIDIFPLHYLYDDEEKENIRQSKANKIWNLLEDYVAGKNNVTKEYLYKEIEEISGMVPDDDAPVLNAVYRIIDKMYTGPKPSKDGYVCLAPFWIQRKSHKFPISYFKDTTLMDFEGFKIRVPAGYEKLLTLEYGSWERINKNGGLHDYPFYTDQENTLAGHFGGKAPYKYYFDKNDILKPEREVTDDNTSFLSSMKKANGLIEKLIAAGDGSSLSVLLGKCQEFAIAVGESIEKTFVCDGADTVKLLEEYCENLYLISRDAFSESEEIRDYTDNLSRLTDEVSIRYDALTKRDAVFVISKKSEWVYAKELYREVLSEGDRKPLVMPVPLYKKDFHGHLSDERFEITKEDFGENINVTDYKSYDFRKMKPDIYIFNPLDEYRESVNIHPFFYSSNLYRYADRLIYVHTLPEKAPDKGNEKGRANAKRFILAPAVLHADTVYVNNEEMRDLYLRYLCEADSSVERTYWERKIQIYNKIYTKPKNEKHEKKILFFYVSISSIYTNRENAIKKLRSVLETFKSEKDKIKVRWVTDAEFDNELKRICTDVYNDYYKAVDVFKAEGLGEYTEYEGEWLINDCDAFYGSGGYYMNLCASRSLPVMVWNVDVV